MQAEIVGVITVGCASCLSRGGLIISDMVNFIGNIPKLVIAFD